MTANEKASFVQGQTIRTAELCQAAVSGTGTGAGDVLSQFTRTLWRFRRILRKPYRILWKFHPLFEPSIPVFESPLAAGETFTSGFDGFKGKIDRFGKIFGNTVNTGFLLIPGPLGFEPFPHLNSQDRGTRAIVEVFRLCLFVFCLLHLGSAPEGLISKRQKPEAKGAPFSPH
jgi:hypothetical protein